MEMCREWLKTAKARDARDTLRYVLYRALGSDGGIKMTHGFTSQLTVEFTNILNSLEVFKRNGLLKPLEIEICLDKFAKGMTNEVLAERHFYSVSEVKTIVGRSLDKILEKVCSD